MQRIMPCIWLSNEIEKVAELYLSAFPDTHVISQTHYSEASSKVSGRPSGSVMTIDLNISGYNLQLLNGGDAGPLYKHSPSLSLFITCGSIDDVDRLYKKLSDGGRTLMEIGEYPFSQRYAFFSDRFGIHWQVMYEEGVKFKITPAIIFGGGQQPLGPKDG